MKTETVEFTSANRTQVIARGFDTKELAETAIIKFLEKEGEEWDTVATGWFEKDEFSKTTIFIVQVLDR